MAAAAAAARPFRFQPAPQLGGREQLRAARRPPPKLFRAAGRVSELVPRWGATGVCRNTGPLALHFCSCGDFFRILVFFLKNHPVRAKCLPQKRFWKWALRRKEPWRGAFALVLQASGRTVVGNAVSAGPDWRGRPLCPPLAHATPRPGVLRHPTALGGQDSSQKLSHSGVSGFSLSCPPTPFLILSFLHVDLDFQNSNQQSVENNLQLRSSTADPLSIKSICKALPPPLPEVAAIGS